MTALPPTPSAPRLVGRVHLGGSLLLPEVDLHLHLGGWTALLGPSGVGKSTLLRLFAGLPIAGQFEGRILDAQPVALMAQDAGLLPWLNVAENASLGARLRGSRPDGTRLDEVLALTDLQAHRDKRPAQLSGGQRQRVALARTLMEDRGLVLLDEPFSALDARMRFMMQDLAARLLIGHTVLLVTHDPSEAARLADQIVVLTGQGLISHDAPRGPAPREPLAPEVLACQSALMARLMQDPRA